jgi:hypothetical protein
MKIFAKISGPLCLILLPVLFESCWTEEGGPQTYFSIKDLKVLIAKQSYGVAEQASSPVNTDQVMLAVKIDAHYAYTERATMGAYADMLPPKSNEKVTAFSITSDSTLTTLDGRTFAPNEDLMSLFDDRNGFWYHNDIDQHISNTDYPFYPNFHLYNKHELNFRVQITLDDGRKFDLDTGVYEFTF